ncbi:protein kinase domain-containing protein [Xanthobacteraceae bacterium A53D]
MPLPQIVFDLPSLPGATAALPYVTELPPPRGRMLVNGTIVVTDEDAPTQFYKFTPWHKAALAFNEIEAYAALLEAGALPGLVSLLGVSGTRDHLVRILERSPTGALDRFMLDQASGEWQRVDTGLARSILGQVAAGMAGLHANHLLHRDLKAENILMFEGTQEQGGETRWVAKVADLDRAVRLAPGDALETPVGSLLHMAPELLAWEKYDRKVDVYAFGMLMFEVLHGGLRPHSNVATSMPGSLTAVEFAAQVVEHGLRPRWRHADAALRGLAERCWSADPAARPEFVEIAHILGDADALQPSGSPGECLRPSGADGPVGMASHIGKVRERMEDAACVLSTGETLIACVFDGMRGQGCSDLLARRFALMLASELAAAAQPESAVSSTFRAAEAALRAVEPPLDCGSTAVVALIRESDILVSWMGDSPAMIFRKGQDGAAFEAVELVNRHHPGRADEAARIQANGGCVGREQRWLDNGDVTPWGPVRVFLPDGGPKAGVALSRALGLFAFKPALGDAPETIRLPRRDDDLFLVLGSDGVFDLLHAEAIHRIAAAAGTAQQAADDLIAEVLKLGAPDNASVIVIDLTQPHAGAGAGLAASNL